MKFEIASIPAVKAFKDGEVVAEFIGAVPPARIEAFLNEIVPSEADRLAESGDEESLRKALELDPGHAQAAIGLSRLLLSRGEDEEALEVLKPFPHDFVADGLAARAQLSASANGAGADELQRAFAAWDDGDPGEALEQLQGVLAVGAGRAAQGSAAPGDGRDLHRAGRGPPAGSRAPPPAGGRAQLESSLDR